MLFFISITEDARRWLCVVLIMVNMGGLGLSVIVMALAAYLSMVLGSYTSLFDSYGGGNLQIFLLAGGAISFICCVVGLYISHQCFVASNRAKLRNAMTMYQMFCFFVVVWLVVCTILIYLHSSYVEDLFKVVCCLHSGIAYTN